MGSSRAVGGHARDLAHGNAPNIGDFEAKSPLAEPLEPAEEAQVLLYFHNANPNQLKIGDIEPSTFLLSPPHDSMAPLLDDIEDCYNAVKGKLNIEYMKMLIQAFTESRIYIYNFNHNLWQIFGDYDSAYAKDKAISYHITKESTKIHVMLVSLFNNNYNNHNNNIFRLLKVPFNWHLLLLFLPFLFKGIRVFLKQFLVMIQLGILRTLHVKPPQEAKVKRIAILLVLLMQSCQLWRPTISTKGFCAILESSRLC